MSEPTRQSGVPIWTVLVVAAGAAGLVLATLGEPAVTWDEGWTIRRESLVRGWFARLWSPPQGVTRRQLFKEPALSTFWPFAREEPHGHPPFYALIGNLGWVVGRGWLAPLEAHRFGPALLYSFTTAAIYWFLARRWGRLAGLVASGTWLLAPRVFTHGHLASYDAPLACLWFLCVAAFWKTQEVWPHSRRAGVAWSGVFAVLLSMAAATKFTGWLIPLPFLCWSAIAGLLTIRTQGPSAFLRLIPLALLVVPWALLVPEVVRLTREVRAIEASLVGSPEFRDSQQRAAEAAETLRRNSAGFLPFSAVLIPVGAWLALGAVLWSRSDPDRSMVPGPIVGTWIAAVALAPPLTIALCPPWWPDPLRGIAIFLWSNLTRQQTTWIPTEFFGRLYDFSLPWYNSLGWIALTLPTGMLFLTVLGVLATVCALLPTLRVSAMQAATTPGMDSQSMEANPKFWALPWLLLLHGMTLIVVRALPGSPGHDGERQLLGSFPFLACLAGLGALYLREQMGRMVGPRVADWGVNIMVGLSLVSASWGIWHYRRAPLSYYTELIGGLRGAARLGLEPTYYWDALDEETIQWLNARTPQGSTVLFCNDFWTLHYLRQWGSLGFGLCPHEQGVPRWYVLQNRPGLFAEKPWDRWLAESGQATFVHELDGVPLIWIFPIEEYEKARRKFESGTSSR